jgi:hypothetical protein
MIGTFVRSAALASVAVLLQADRPVPFQVGESLRYDVGWSTYLTAGTATLTVKERRPAGSAGAVYDLIAEGQPTSLLDRLYHVYYKAETLLNTSTLQPTIATLYSDERGRTRLKTARFLTATSLEFQARSSAPREKRTIPAGTVDPLSAVYVLRTLPLKAGQAFTMSVVEDTTVYSVKWQVAGPELVKSGLGTLSAWRLTPVVTDGKGKPITGRQVIVWLSDDSRRLPLKFQAGLPIGSFTLTLSSSGG